MDERNHQVTLMREIYKQASTVLVWLGHQSLDSNVAMEYLATAALGPLSTESSEYQSLWTREQREALRNLTKRPYWKRMWIIQEILNAKEILVVCGSKTFPWKALENLYHNIKWLSLRSCIGQYEFAIELLKSPTLELAWRRALYRNPLELPHTLLDLLETFRYWEYRNILDKVYSLLGLLPRAVLKPDYSLTPSQLYRQAENLRYPNHDLGKFRKALRGSLGISEKYRHGRRDQREYRDWVDPMWVPAAY
jgi:hypothetical protein